MRQQWLLYLVENLRLERSFWGDAVFAKSNNVISSLFQEAFLDPELGVLTPTCAFPLRGVKGQL